MNLVALSNRKTGTTPPERMDRCLAQRTDSLRTDTTSTEQRVVH